MNAKKCKALRKHLRATGVVPTIYQSIERRAKLVPNGKLNEDGTQQMVVITPVTVVLGDCDRRYYQSLKRSYNQ